MAVRTAAATEWQLREGALRRAHKPTEVDRSKRTLKAGVSAGTVTLADLVHELVESWPEASPELVADIDALLASDAQ